jgi:hypothetical protein
MPEIEIPPALADLQRAVDAAQAAVRQHHRGVGRPVLEWTGEERAEADRLEAAWKTAAAELQAAIEADGQEVGQAYEYRRALRKAAYGEDYAGQ